MKMALCKSVMFCGFGNSVSSEYKCKCDCRFIFQFVEWFFCSFLLSVLCSTFSRPCPKIDNRTRSEFKRMQNVQFIVANLKTFDDNESAVNAIFLLIQMCKWWIQLCAQIEKMANCLAAVNKSCRIIILPSFILKSDLHFACMHRTALNFHWFLFSYFNLSQFDLLILFLSLFFVVLKF